MIKSKVFLGLGTNLGDKETNLRLAIKHIEEQIGNCIALSAFYVTAPWGFNSSNSFLNAVAQFETSYSPTDVLSLTQSIEKEMGRLSKSVNHHYADRIIDIDILLYDDWCYHSRKLVIPHPLMQDRKFVMEPLAEIASDLKHPTLGLEMLQLAEVAL